MINIKEEIDEIKSESLKIRNEVIQKISGYMFAAFGLVAALAWNDAIKSLIEQFSPIEKSTVIIKFIYAVLITIIVVITSYYLTKLLTKKEGKKD